MSFYFDVYMSTYEYFKSLASVFSFLYICVHYHFVLAGSYALNSVLPNYILRFISSFLRSFRFLIFVLLYSIYSLTLSSRLLTALIYSI